MNKIAQIHTQLVDKDRELANKRKFLETRKIESQFNQVMEQLNSEGSLEITNEDKVFTTGKISQSNSEYMEAVKNRLPFINQELGNLICLGGKTLYLVCGGTGGGKSTTVGAIIGPVLDQGKKVLVIVNEEAREDVYNRVACQRLGKNFVLFKQAQLHQSEVDRINEEAESLQSVMTVIDTDFKHNPDFVTTPQGIAKVLEAFAFDHDMVVIDYYQNISRSTAASGDLRPEPWNHQLKFCHWINSFKNKYGKPIVVMSQIRKPNKTDSSTFEERLMGSKYIATVSLIHIELRADFQNYSTTFLCHKDRFWGKTGKGMVQGFDWTSNRFVPYDDAFAAKVAHWQTQYGPKDTKEVTSEPLEENTSGSAGEAPAQPGEDLLVLDDLV